MTPTPPAPGPPDGRDGRDDRDGDRDPAAPLEAYVAAIEHVCGEYCDDAMLVDDADARGVRLHLGDLRQAAAALRERAATIARLEKDRKAAVNTIATIMRAVEQRRNHFRPLEIWTNGRLFARMRSAIGPMAREMDGGSEDA